jgi:hypothetical protein
MYAASPAGTATARVASVAAMPRRPAGRIRAERSDRSAGQRRAIAGANTSARHTNRIEAPASTG